MKTWQSILDASFVIFDIGNGMIYAFYNQRTTELHSPLHTSWKPPN